MLCATFFYLLQIPISTFYYFFDLLPDRLSHEYSTRKLRRKITWRKARAVFDPATLKAEQTKNPASSLCTPWILNVPSELTCMCPCDVSGNMSSWEPSLFQKTDGGGLPVAAQSNSTTPFKLTFWSRGSSVKVGGAVREAREKRLGESAKRIVMFKVEISQMFDV